MKCFILLLCAFSLTFSVADSMVLNKTNANFKPAPVAAADDTVTYLKVTALCGAFSGMQADEIPAEYIKPELTFKDAANAENFNEVVNSKYFEADNGKNSGYKNCKIRIINIKPANSEMSACEWIYSTTYKPKNGNVEPVCSGTVYCKKGIYEGQGIVSLRKSYYQGPAFCNAKNNACPTAPECASEKPTVTKYVMGSDYMSEKYEVEVKEKK
jgi:hypothetical protein